LTLPELQEINHLGRPRVSHQKSTCFELDAGLRACTEKQQHFLTFLCWNALFCIFCYTNFFCGWLWHFPL